MCGQIASPHQAVAMRNPFTGARTALPLPKICFDTGPTRGAQVAITLVPKPGLTAVQASNALDNLGFVPPSCPMVSNVLRSRYVTVVFTPAATTIQVTTAEDRIMSTGVFGAFDVKESASLLPPSSA